MHGHQQREELFYQSKISKIKLPEQSISATNETC